MTMDATITTATDARPRRADTQHEPVRPDGGALQAARARLLALGSAAAPLQDLLTLVLGREPEAETLKRLLGEVASVRALARLSPRQIARLPGVGLGSAVRLAAALELGARAGAHEPLGESFRTARDVYAAFRFLGALDRETFWVLALDTRNRLLRAVRVCEGTGTHCIVRPRDVIGPVLRESGTTAVVLHNHPSGDPEPSALDVALTQRIVRAAELMGIRLLDHVVVAAGGFTSLRERGQLDDGGSGRAVEG